MTIQELMEEAKQKVFESLGQASMCWTETPKGVFKSEEAERIGEELLDFLSHAIDQTIAAVRVEKEEPHDKECDEWGDPYECVCKKKTYYQAAEDQQAKIDIFNGKTNEG